MLLPLWRRPRLSKPPWVRAKCSTADIRSREVLIQALEDVSVDCEVVSWLLLEAHMQTVSRLDTARGGNVGLGQTPKTLSMCRQSIDTDRGVEKSLLPV